MILIIDRNLHGHRIEFVNHILSFAKTANEKVALWIEDQDYSSKIETLATNPIVETVLQGAFTISKLRQFISLHRDVQIVFLDGDQGVRHVVRNPWLFRKLTTRILFLRLNRPRLAQGPLRLGKYLLKLLLAVFAKIAAKARVSRLVFLRKGAKSFFGQVRDPLPVSPDLAMVSKDLLGGPVRVGIVGTLDPRKSVELAIRSTAELGANFQLILAGEVSPSFKDELRRILETHNEVILIDKYLTEDEMSRLISDMDVFLVLQRENIPSSTLLRALSYGVPTVVGGARVLKSCQKEFPELVLASNLSKYCLKKAIIAGSKLHKNPVKDLPRPLEFAQDLLQEINP